MTRKKKSLWVWTRWGLLGMALLTGSALLLTLWSSYQSTQRIATQVTRAEGYSLFHSVRQKLHAKTRIEDRDLQALLSELRGAGLRYIGAFRLRGRLMASAGTALGSTSFPLRRKYLYQNMTRLNKRVRMLTIGLQRKKRNPWRMFRRWERRMFAQDWSAPRTLDSYRKFQAERRRGNRSMRRRFRRRPVLFAIEFEPLSARLIQSEAQRTLLIGGVAAFVLLAFTSLFWLLLGRMSKLEEQRFREQQLAALGEMSAVMAHEIRNPLTSLKGHAQLLVEYLPEGEKTKAKAERVVHEAKRLEHLSSQLLDFVRMGSLELSEVEPIAMLQDVAAMFDASKFVWETKRAPRQWQMDETRIRQVVANLLQNAIQSSPEEEKKVTIQVTQEGQQLRIAVRDQGPGVPEKDLQNIFTPFYTTRLHGTGLGLAVASRWVELHQGTLSVSNLAEQGAEFVVCLPQARKT